MNSQKTTLWDLGRFVKTLSYFGAIPFLSSVDWFQQWLGSRPDPTVDSRTLVDAQTLMDTQTTSAPKIGNSSSSTGSLLVIGAETSVGQQVVRQLTAQDRALKLVDLERAPLVPTDLEQVTAVMCCADDPGDPTNSQFTHQLIQQVADRLGQQYQPIFDFAHPASDVKDIWGALDDVVMGGVSQSNLRLADGVAYFSGTVSTANSGGFASVRTRNLEPPLDLSTYDGVELRVKGDGKRYKFMIRTETRWDGVAHCYSFDTIPDQWATVRVPFQALIPVFRARTIDGSPLNLHQVSAWQLMLSKFEYNGALNPHFEPGFFQLQVASIQVYRQTPKSAFVLINSDEASATALKNSGIPYTLIYASPVIDQPGGRTLQIDRQPLGGQVSAADVAAVGIAALEYPEARNATFYVTSNPEAQEDDRPSPDWARLFAGITGNSSRV